eukprot:1780491-Pyramimonas_sp.AAC.1
MRLSCCRRHRSVEVREHAGVCVCQPVGRWGKAHHLSYLSSAPSSAFRPHCAPALSTWVSIQHLDTRAPARTCKHKNPVAASNAPMVAK